MFVHNHLFAIVISYHILCVNHTSWPVEGNYRITCIDGFMENYT